jgi:hypothetical protein
MSLPVLLSKTSLKSTVTATAASLATGLDLTASPGVNIYELVSSTNCWWAQGIPDTVFTAAVTDICTTSAAHNLRTGDALMVSSSVTLPAGLSAATVYWAIVLSTTTFKLATTRALALAGTAVDITTTGTGVHTATTTASAAAGSAYLPANTPVRVDGTQGAKLSIIRDTLDGNASITQVMVVR